MIDLCLDTNQNDPNLLITSMHKQGGCMLYSTCISTFVRMLYGMCKGYICQGMMDRWLKCEEIVDPMWKAYRVPYSGKYSEG